MLVGADEKKMEQVREAMLQMISGWNQQHVASIVRETLDEIVTPIIYAEALDLIDVHHAAGRKVVIVSSAPEEVVRPLGEFLGVDDVIATRAAVDDDGNYTGELEFYVYGPHKAEAVRELAAREGHRPRGVLRVQRLDHRRADARAVGHPVAVNPDRDLARLARAEGWGVENFEHPVRLRDRVPVPARGPGDRGRRRARGRGRRRDVVVAPPPHPCRVTRLRSPDEPARRSGRAPGPHEAGPGTRVCRLVLMAFGVRPRGPCGPR